MGVAVAWRNINLRVALFGAFLMCDIAVLFIDDQQSRFRNCIFLQQSMGGDDEIDIASAPT